MNFHINTDS